MADDQDQASDSSFGEQVRSQFQDYMVGLRNIQQAAVPHSPEQAGEMAAYATPSVGQVLSARDTYNALIPNEKGERDWLGAALGAVGMIPLGGMVTGPLKAAARNIDALGYYSHALEAAKALPQAKGTPEQMLAMLKKGGVKDAELQATGTHEFLEGKPSVTRDELAQHLEENRVGLNATVRDPQWSVYSLDPKNPTYRETVLHLGVPEENVARAQALAQREKELFDHYSNLRRSGADPSELNNATEELNRVQDELKSLNQSVFRSGHFDEPNITGHLMTSMVKDKNGRNVFNVDQIQSDWGQKLREGGVRDEAKIAKLEVDLGRANEESRRIEAEAGKFIETVPYRDMNVASYLLDNANPFYQVPYGPRGDVETLANYGQGDIQRKAREFHNALKYALENENLIEAELSTAKQSPSGHPLVNTTDQWVNTTLRHAIKQAAESGADAISIPSGKTVLSYNPGKEHGMEEFYNRIVPKNLGNILKKIDPSVAKPEFHEQMITRPPDPRHPASFYEGGVRKGKGFTVFPLTDKIKKSVMEEGQPLFAAGGEVHRADGGDVPGDQPQPQASLDQDKANFSQAVHQGLNQFTQGVSNLAPKTPEQAAGMALDATPIIGNIRSAQQGYEAYQKGDWLGTALGAIGSVPLVGGIFMPAKRAQIMAAEALERQGYNPNQILKQTGAHRNVEGDWTREISDVGSHVIPNEEALTQEGGTAGPARAMFEHPELYKEAPGVTQYHLEYEQTPQFITAEHPNYLPAYERAAEMWEQAGSSPKEILENVKMRRGPNGEWMQESLPSGQHWGQEKIIGAIGGTPESLRSTTLHEFQHAIDKAAGRPSGANPDTIYRTLATLPPENIVKLGEESRSLGSKSAPNIANYADNWDGYLRHLADDLYRRDVGEARARTTEARKNLTTSQRLNMHPFKDMDVPPEQQINVSNKTAALLNKLKRDDGGAVSTPTQEQPLPPPKMPFYGGTLDPTYAEGETPALAYGFLAGRIPALTRGAANFFPEAVQNIASQFSPAAAGVASGVWGRNIFPAVKYAAETSGQFPTGQQRAQQSDEPFYEETRRYNAQRYQQNPQGFLKEVNEWVGTPAKPGTIDKLVQENYLRGLPPAILDTLMPRDQQKYLMQGQASAPSAVLSDANTTVRNKSQRKHGGSISDKTYTLLSKLKNRA